MTLSPGTSIAITPLGAAFGAADPHVPVGAQVHLRCADDTERRIQATSAPPHFWCSIAPMMRWRSALVAASGLRICDFDTVVTLCPGAPITVDSPIPLASAILRLRFPRLDPGRATIALRKDGAAPAACRLVGNGDLLDDAFAADPAAAAALDRVAAAWFDATAGAFGEATLLDFRFALIEVTGHARMAASRFFEPGEPLT